VSGSLRQRTGYATLFLTPTGVYGPNFCQTSSAMPLTGASQSSPASERHVCHTFPENIASAHLRAFRVGSKGFLLINGSARSCYHAAITWSGSSAPGLTKEGGIEFEASSAQKGSYQ
jgi:hypothetical protein